MSDDKKQQFNIYLRSDFIREVKHAAVDARTSLSDFVAEALEAHMRQKQGKIQEALTDESGTARVETIALTEPPTAAHAFRAHPGHNSIKDRPNQ